MWKSLLTVRLQLPNPIAGSTQEAVPSPGPQVWILTSCDQIFGAILRQTVHRNRVPHLQTSLPSYPEALLQFRDPLLRQR